MPDRLVVDASVVARAFFNDAKSELARELMTSGAILIAPELLLWEMANVAATRVLRAGADPAQCREAVETLTDFIDEFVGGASLAVGAYRLALETGCSAYDGAYLALAQMRQIKLVTADFRFADRVEAAGYDFLIRRL
jgi:predicted nucleic acid-binding protein